ncbi:hypothetical protein Y032_0033g2699 [Ancylostoma ceylanicum]|uniref:ABC transporter domain-containing protein n=1 Tax=Ancylostoma ceylanicum TaxID=53326 RepID=A0A016UPX3_9BILA|nr:hypothetical protein Y032_0033g2699 [Ancylostoma ceylanicum]
MRTSLNISKHDKISLRGTPLELPIKLIASMYLEILTRNENILPKLPSNICSSTFFAFSGGQRRRVCIGVALMNPSKLVILDEPTAGIDPKTRHQVWGLLKKMRLSGKAIVLSSHSMEECEALCSRIGVLVKGRLVAIGASQALKTRHADNFFLHVSLNSLSDKNHVVNTVLTTFPSGTLATKREDALTLKFKIRQRKEDKVSALYEKAQTMASSLPLKDFILIQASLEDVLEILNEEYSGKVL